MRGCVDRDSWVYNACLPACTHVITHFHLQLLRGAQLSIAAECTTFHLCAYPQPTALTPVLLIIPTTLPDTGIIGDALLWCRGGVPVKRPGYCGCGHGGAFGILVANRDMLLVPSCPLPAAA